MKSVGEYSPTVVSVNSACSVGGMAEGGVGMAGMPYPPTKTPTDCTDVHRLGAKTQPKNAVSICEIRGRIFSDSRFCEFGEFCGRTPEGGVGMAGMPYPPTKTPTDCTNVHRLGATNAT